jgi:hypothetical protein
MDEETVCLHLARSRSSRERLAELFAHAVSNEPLWSLVEAHVRFEKPLPVALTKALIEDKKKPAKRGRHARSEEIGRQRADDVAIFAALGYLVLEKKMKMTPACEQVGRLMGLTRQAVRKAWEREKRRPLKKE